MNTSPRGFTLVELLVVASIISLLSSVTTSNIRLIKERSENASKNHVMEQYKAAFELFYTSNGRYPSPATWDPIKVYCLGEHIAGMCGYFDPSGFGFVGLTGIPAPELDAEVESVFPAGPVFKLMKTDSTGNQFLGPLYTCSAFIPESGPCPTPSFLWYEQGETDCIGGADRFYNGVSTRCRIDF